MSPATAEMGSVEPGQIIGIVVTGDPRRGLFIPVLDREKVREILKKALA